MLLVTLDRFLWQLKILNFPLELRQELDWPFDLLQLKARLRLGRDVGPVRRR